MAVLRLDRFTVVPGGPAQMLARRAAAVAAAMNP